MYNPVRTVRHWQRYRQILGVFIQHGFGAVLDRLGPEQQSLRRVLQLPACADIAAPAENLALHFRMALEELGPTFIKLGQILSTRPDLLPPSYIDELSKLRDATPPVSWQVIRDVLERELGSDPQDIFLTIDHQPLAAASLAQVHAATLPDGSDVVVKVQRPGITGVIDADLEILASLALRAQATSLGAIYDFVSMADDFAYTMRNELDYCREARNAELFRKNFAGEAHLYVPRIYWDFCSPRVLVLERLRGLKMDDLQGMEAAGYDRHQVAVNSTRMIVKEILEDGFFHADAHPGNYMILPGEVIGVVDFGMVGYLSEKDRLNLIRLYYVAVALDAEGVADQLIRMGAAGEEVNRAGLTRDINRLLTKYHSLPLKEIRAGAVIEEILPISFRHHLRLPPDLWLVGKTLVMLEGIGLKLDPDFDMFAVSKPFAQRMMMEGLLPHPVRGQGLLRYGSQWSELVRRLPDTGSRLLERAERGDLLQLGVKDSAQLLQALDRLTTRLVTGLVVAALIIGLAMLVTSTAAGHLVQGLVIAGFLVAALLGVWLLARK